MEGFPGLASSSEAPVQVACTRFLDSCRLPPGARERIEVVLASGKLETLLSRQVLDRDIDLVVLGLNGQAGVLRVLLGSTAERLLRGLACDTMLVRAEGHDDAA